MSQTISPPRGARVRLARWFVEAHEHGVSADHIAELRDRIGIVSGPTDYGMGHIYPEVDVLWPTDLPACMLRYSYLPEELEILSPP